MSARTVREELATLTAEAAQRCRPPPVRTVWWPPPAAEPPKSGEFCAVVLEDGSTGLAYALLARGAPTQARPGTAPVELLAGLTGDDPAHRALGLAAANAIAQHLFARKAAPLAPAVDPVAGIDPRPGERVGMVGYFPPLVARLRGRGVPLTVLELREELVGREDDFEVTLDPAALEGCALVLCTSTVVLNDTLDEVLARCRRARRVAVLGPSAGFLPDPLFAHGVHAVGGNRVTDAGAFLARCRAGEPWGGVAAKYLIERRSWPGTEALLARVR